jgi:hypothetical protein
VVRHQKRFLVRACEAHALKVALPQLGGCGEVVALALGVREVVVHDDLLAVGGEREVKPKDLRVVLRLLEPVVGRRVLDLASTTARRTSRVK